MDVSDAAWEQRLAGWGCGFFFLDLEFSEVFSEETSNRTGQVLYAFDLETIANFYLC